MDKEVAGPTCAGYLLEWLAIQDACAAGCGTYHSASRAGRAALALKEKFGARPVEYAEPASSAAAHARDALARRSSSGPSRFRDA